ncbi:conserved hypothetical protein [Trichophyton verrucosum HKI 0517]|uniref:Uncharacterized protein n=1 Tax=Trichophyton verrucosum (strain HKI 0517) TaxID=663202 RepID=D4DB17_TRIVH|nr:uncharacterized protein TRV_04316 [Trichophyton verrucosum HKI 0517]EFE40956.1 conserved hypothetical protein [Trichophyton verrucosum HKI 0517]
MFFYARREKTAKLGGGGSDAKTGKAVVPARNNRWQTATSLNNTPPGRALNVIFGYLVIGDLLIFNMVSTYIGRGAKWHQANTSVLQAEPRWTLRFKNHNVTVLLLVSPVDAFDTIKAALLKALQTRGIKEINGKPVPDDAADIELGVPLDRNNLEKGWQPLAIPDGKADKGAGKGKNSVFNSSPQGADLRDAQAIAFRFRKASERSAVKDGDLEMDLDDPGWDVLIPSYDDEDEDE